MARAPRPGRAKTRLLSHLSPQGCAGLATAFLRDALDVLIEVQTAAHYLAFTPPEEEALLAQLAPPTVALLPQVGADLGERLHNVFVALSELGHGPALIFGSDIPTLQRHTLEDALVKLHTADVCLGPSADGGYYLIGLRTPCPSLFEGIPWGTEEVFQMTVDRVREAGLSLATVECYRDIDTIDDMIWLQGQVTQQDAAGNGLRTHTRAFLEDLAQKRGPLRI